MFHPFFLTGARNVYHQLFMSSLLMDLKYKKLFAIRFARVSIFLTKRHSVLKLSSTESLVSIQCFKWTLIRNCLPIFGSEKLKWNAYYLNSGFKILLIMASHLLGRKWSFQAPQDWSSSDVFVFTINRAGCRFLRANRFSLLRCKLLRHYSEIVLKFCYAD